MICPDWECQKKAKASLDTAETVDRLCGISPELIRGLRLKPLSILGFRMARSTLLVPDVLTSDDTNICLLPVMKMFKLLRKCLISRHCSQSRACTSTTCSYETVSHMHQIRNQKENRHLIIEQKDGKLNDKTKKQPRRNFWNNDQITKTVLSGLDRQGEYNIINVLNTLKILERK